MVTQPALVLAGLLAGTELLFTVLDYLNLGHGARAVRTADGWVRGELGVEDPDRLLAYQRAKTVLSRTQSWVSLFVLLAVVLSGAFADAVSALVATGLPTPVQGVLLVVAAVVGSRLLSVPFGAYQTFRIEERFGFNNRTVGLWLRDSALGLALSAAFAAVVGGVVLGGVEALPTLWPVAGWGAVVGLSLVMLVVYPRFVAPLFNDFDPIEAGPLRDAVEDVFDRAGFDCEQVYEMDASRRSSHSNAYFVGFGRTKRVVLFDTLVEQMNRSAMQAVLAHELAHWKRAHIWKQVGLSALRTAVVFAFLGWVAASEWAYAAFSLPEVTYAGLVVGLLFAGPILSLTSPLTNRLSLSHEREADDFAADVMGDPEPLVDALRTLAGENLSNPFPHPAYAAFHMSHPPIPERIRRLRERHGEGAGGDGDAPPAPTA